MVPTFGDDDLPVISLCARARQFSNYLIVIGNVIGSNSFKAQHAVIVQNKEEFLVPLLLQQIPTPKEFDDATISLSDKQREFAQMFRAMQLETSTLSFCVIQIKPQLERLLDLSAGSLTKELSLTQEIIELTSTYQIPGDVLRFHGDSSTPSSARLEQVRNRAQELRNMIEEQKANELREAERQEELLLLELAKLQKLKEERRKREEQDLLYHHKMILDMPPTQPLDEMKKISDVSSTRYNSSSVAQSNSMKKRISIFGEPVNTKKPKIAKTADSQRDTQVIDPHVCNVTSLARNTKFS